VLYVTTSTSRERFGNLVFLNLVFSFRATPEVWVATKVVCAREKMSYEPKKSPELKILDPLWTSSKSNSTTVKIVGTSCLRERAHNFVANFWHIPTTHFSVMVRWPFDSHNEFP
jgi:hypothetical protein